MTQDVSRETLEKARLLAQEHENLLNEYRDQLLWWNARVNLVSRSVSRETVENHLIHSLIPEVLGLVQGADLWVDAGSGGGLPGIPLAIVAPERRWILNDRSDKKMIAVKQMVQSLGLEHVETRSGSIETIHWPGIAGVISKHAFPVTRLLPLIQKKKWNRLIMYKGVSEPDVESAVKGVEGFRTDLYRFTFEQAPFYENKGILCLERTVQN